MERRIANISVDIDRDPGRMRRLYSSSRRSGDVPTSPQVSTLKETKLSIHNSEFKHVRTSGGPIN